MSLEEPIEPEFRIAQMGLGYDAEHDIIVLVVQGQTDASIDEDDLGIGIVTGEDEDEDELLVRFAATRHQMRALSIQAARVVEAGRPICGNCGQPMDATGHFCPERNGHGPIAQSS
jgi:uncharacterized repeat protein (TIGR03847 family)